MTSSAVPALLPLQRAPSGLHYLVRPASTHTPSLPKRQLFLLHGVGGNEHNLATLAEQIDPRIEVILLRGPLTLAPAQYGWFQVHFGTSGPVIDAEQANRSRQQLVTTLAALSGGGDVSDRRTVIAGFSQGGIMSASVALSAPETVNGFAILSGRILPELSPYIAGSEKLRGLSGFIAHGLFDNKLPVAWAQRADEQLTALEVEHVTRTYPIGHELSAESVGDFEQWLRGPLAL